MPWPCRLGAFLLCLMLGAAAWPAMAADSLAGRRLVVGTADMEPFAMPVDQGKYRGLSMDLWAQIALDLGITFELREMAFEDLLQAVQRGELDLAVTAITVTSSREKLFDFTHPYFHTGLAIAVPADATHTWWHTLASLATSRPVVVVSALVLGLVLMGVLVWLAERRRNREQFGRGVLGGLGEGMWWSAQTLTSVGYGDKAPITTLGRLLAFLWMLVSLVLVSLFTAVITTTLTVAHMATVVRDVQDLFTVRVGTVAATTSETFLERQRVDFRVYQAALEAMDALAKGQIDAMVFDQPVLQYLAKAHFPGRVKVLGRHFDPQDYAFALPNGSPLRKPINQALLKRIHGDSWKQVLFQYLGSEAGRRGPAPPE